MNKIGKIIRKLQRRFATKVFDPNFKIPRDLENKVEEIFNLAPTSFGLQPFKLVKVSNEKDRETICEIAWNQKQILDCSLLYILAIETNMNAVLARYEKSLIKVRKVEDDKATQYSDFIRDFYAQRSLDGSFYESWATRQTYLALGFFLSIATILGVDTAPLEGFDEKELEKVYDLKKYELSPKVLLCIGKRSVFDNYPKLPKIRKHKSQLVFLLS